MIGIVWFLEPISNEESDYHDRYHMVFGAHFKWRKWLSWQVSCGFWSPFQMKKVTIMTSIMWFSEPISNEESDYHDRDHVVFGAHFKWRKWLSWQVSCGFWSSFQMKKVTIMTGIVWFSAYC